MQRKEVQEEPDIERKTTVLKDIDPNSFAGNKICGTMPTSDSGAHHHFADYAYNRPEGKSHEE